MNITEQKTRKILYALNAAAASCRRVSFWQS